MRASFTLWHWGTTVCARVLVRLFALCRASDKFVAFLINLFGVRSVCARSHTVRHHNLDECDLKTVSWVAKLISLMATIRQIHYIKRRRHTRQVQMERARICSTSSIIWSLVAFFCSARICKLKKSFRNYKFSFGIDITPTNEWDGTKWNRRAEWRHASIENDLISCLLATSIVYLFINLDDGEVAIGQFVHSRIKWCLTGRDTSRWCVFGH